MLPYTKLSCFEPSHLYHKVDDVDVLQLLHDVDLIQQVRLMLFRFADLVAADRFNGNELAIELMPTEPDSGERTRSDPFNNDVLTNIALDFLLCGGLSSKGMRRRK